MKSYSPKAIRNFALVGHQGTGKTTLAESLLFHTGAIPRMGSVDDGSSNLDYHRNEIARKTTIYNHLGACEFEDTKFNLLDTPGFEDFHGEVVAAISVVEGVLAVVRSDTGVEVGTEARWREVADANVPAMVVISKMDKENADFAAALADVRARLSAKAIPVQLPIGSAEGFRGIVDIAAGKAWIYEKPGEPHEEAVPADMQAEYEAAREELLDAAAEHDDELVEKYLEEGDLPYEDIVRGVRVGMRNRSVFPVCVISASNGMGIRPLLHWIKEAVPAAADRGDIPARRGEEITTLPTGHSKPTLARIFQMAMERDAGDMSYIRVFGGKLKSGDEIYNLSRDHGERIGQLFSLEGKIREKIDQIATGDFGAAVKLKDSHPGDTLGDKDLDATLRRIRYPEPVARLAIRPAHQGDDDKMAEGLARLHEEDPTFSFHLDPETHEEILEGQGELHFDVILDRLKDRFGVEVTRHEPRIPYRETLRSKIEVSARHKKQSGGRGQFADVSLSFEPMPRGGGFDFVNKIVGGAIPGKFIPAVEKGLTEAMEKGPLSGCQVVDLRATLHDGGFHAVDSSEQAFKTAAAMAMREAFGKAKAVLLEPIYRVEVICPEDAMGDVMGDLSSRRGRIQGSEQKGRFTVVTAEVPLAELYRYSTALRSVTQGRGTHRREFAHYEEVPADTQAKIIESAREAAH